MVVQSLKRVDATAEGELEPGSEAVKSHRSVINGDADRNGVCVTARRRQSPRILTLEMARKERLARRRGQLQEVEENVRLKKKVLLPRVVAMVEDEEKASGEATEEELPVLAVPPAEKKDNAAADKSDYVKTKESLCDRSLGGCKDEENGALPDGANPTNVAPKSDHAKVKETLRLFNKHYLHFVQEEEKRCFVDENSKKSKKGNVPGEKQKDTSKRPDLKAISKKGNVPGEEKKKNTAKRPDLKAITKMQDDNTVLFPDKRIGDIPGIKVGHQFYSRAEMVVLGFHSHWLNGIDFMGMKYKDVHKNYKFPLACAVVLSGMYEDDLDKADEIVYTGQGGHNLTGDKRQIRDQKLERGNLALKHCIDHAVPVRVVRGHDCKHSYTGRIYTYDGLYKVVQYWADKGISGFTVFKYRLRRVEGQPMLTTNQVQFFNGRVPQSVSDLRGLVCDDIAGGLENFAIPATNLVDEPPVAPTGFKYISKIQVAKNVTFPKAGAGCNCKGSCRDPRICACAKLNGSHFPYVDRDGGRLIEPKDVVYECGPNCGCGPDCINRVSQRGLKYRLEVFRAPRKGWAVRSWDFIPSGAPVCEYIGVLKRSEDVESGSENSYIFDIDCIQTMKGLEGRERRSRNPSSQAIDEVDCEDLRNDTPEYCIDAGPSGSVARFVNHSCEPNLYVQCILSSHRDMKFARVVLVAADNIPPLQELTYDYGYALDSVLGPDGKVKQMLCYCGGQNCRKRMF